MTAVSGVITPETAVKGIGSLAARAAGAPTVRTYWANPVNRATVRDERLADVARRELVLFGNPHDCASSGPRSCVGPPRLAPLPLVDLALRLGDDVTHIPAEPDVARVFDPPGADVRGEFGQRGTQRRHRVGQQRRRHRPAAIA